ncbi:MAG: hypothetical protein CMF63_08730 [Magnetovibrio sp.]|nr:hypothetical protein [Magnetovibrio sp.]
MFRKFHNTLRQWSRELFMVPINRIEYNIRFISRGESIIYDNLCSYRKFIRMHWNIVSNGFGNIKSHCIRKSG